MYDLVYAVNQQYPENGSPGGLLILTKFAELVIDSNRPRASVGNKRFCAMTRMTRNTVNSHLEKLKASNFLVPLDDPSKKRKGDMPILYELRLPEGFDQKTVMDRHRHKYYGGKYLNPEYIDLASLGIKEDITLPPVPIRIVADTKVSEIDKPTSEIDKPTSNSDIDMSKSDRTMSKIAPSNKQKNNNINNNKSSVSNDVVDDDFLEEYCKDTNLSPALFKKLGINRENIHLLKECITYWKDILSNNRDNIRNPPGYLITIIRDTIANGKLNYQFSPIQPKPASQNFDDAYKKLEAEKKIVEEKNRDYEYPNEVKSVAEQIATSARLKFNIPLDKEKLCDMFDRYIVNNQTNIAKIVDDFKKTCNLSNPTDESLLDWIRSYLSLHMPRG